MAEFSSYFQTRDNLSIRYARFSPHLSPTAGTVVLLGGRAEFIEKYEETIEELNTRHLTVFTLDWRGQGLSSRLLEDSHKGHVDSFISYIEDLQYFFEKIVLPDAVPPSIILAHSMGGHIALRYLKKAQPPISGAVLVAPMINICTKPVPHGLARWLARLANWANWSDKYIVGAGYYNPEQKLFKDNPLTSDPQRFMDEHRKIEENPSLALGGVTYGWLSAAFDSINEILCDNSWRYFDVPVLMIGGKADRVISIPAMRRMCQGLPDCRCVILEEGRHEILKETDSIRRHFWREFDQFMAKFIPH